MGKEELGIKLFIAKLFIMVARRRGTIGLGEIWWSQTVGYCTLAVSENMFCDMRKCHDKNYV